MEFEINIQHGLNGHVEITDYSVEYGQYYPEDANGMTNPDKFKYSESNSLNAILRVTSDQVTLDDVLLDLHDKDKELLVFDVNQDGYYMIIHFVLPNATWVNNQLTSANNLLPNYSVVYYIDNFKVYKRDVVKSTNLTNSYSLSEPKEVSIRELIERNVEGTSILKCQIDIFYTGYLQECYINHCKEIFNNVMKRCKSVCSPNDDQTFSRDFLWMTLNVIDYLIEREQYREAQRILEEINYCGGFCNNLNNHDKSVCKCNSNDSRTTCNCH